MTRLARRDPWALALAALLVVTGAALLHLGRGTTFIYDDWDFWLMAQSYAPSELFQHYNGQASLVPKLLWATTTHVFGGGEYAPFRVGAVLLHLAFLAGLFAVLRPRVGGAVALAVVLPLTLLGGAALTLLMANTLHYFELPLLWLVWAIVALDRGTRRGDVVASVLMIAAAFTSSSGLAVVAAIGAYLAWERPQWRRWWVVGIPAAFYLVWLVAERPEQRGVTTRSDFALIPGYIAEGASQGLARYTALGGAFATPLAMALIAAFVVQLARGARLDRAAIAFATGGATLWALIAIGRGPEVRTWTPQYLFPDAVYPAVALVLLASGALLLRTPRVAVLALLAGVAFAIPNAETYVDEARISRAQAEDVLAGVSAVNVLAGADPRAAASIDPPDVVRRDIDYEPETYVRRIAEGREVVGVRPDELPAQSERFRATADRFLAAALELRTGAATARDGRDCRRVDPGPGGFASTDGPAEAPFVVVPASREAVDVRLLRYATTPLPDEPPFARLEGEGRGARFAPRPVAGAGWRVAVASTGSFLFCGG